MNNKNTFVLLLVLVVIIAGAMVAYNYLGDRVDADNLAQSENNHSSETQDGGQEEDRESAPDFTVTNLAGESVKLSDFRGKPAVVNFWASWCGPCKMEMPDFNEKYLEIGDDVTFLMVNMTDGSRETVDIASAFIAEQGYSFPVFYDTASSAAMTYGIYSLPTTFFIDAQGNAIAQATGAIDAATLQKGIDMIYS